ncbi:hypothetical protein LTS10_002842 [Elasticomyces elasticus]|nr:hypothetical protein LTS10_002842 [Elasticomyces elasticus]
MSLPPLDQGPWALTEKNLAWHTAKVRDDDVDELDVRVGRWLHGIEEARVRGHRERQAGGYEHDLGGRADCVSTLA